ncbi:hypothetical protein BKA61DRAFT_584794 [Leptodontidium sp. MPI-SDFR-AT-0119]|nr:hypothetical protein BKA61DRAFT_584794 [Leptodontidium sp. MPI-SDFR-AT-0119]
MCRFWEGNIVTLYCAIAFSHFDPISASVPRAVAVRTLFLLSFVSFWFDIFTINSLCTEDIDLVDGYSYFLVAGLISLDWSVDWQAVLASYEVAQRGDMDISRLSRRNGSSCRDRRGSGRRSGHRKKNRGGAIEDRRTKDADIWTDMSRKSQAGEGVESQDALGDQRNKGASSLSTVGVKSRKCGF